MKTKLAIGLGVLCLGASSVIVVGKIGEYQGYARILTAVTARTLSSRPPAGQFLDNGLLDLLGSHSGFGNARRFVNGVPNSLNVTVYHVFSRKLAHEFATVCDGRKSLPPMPRPVPKGKKRLPRVAPTNQFKQPYLDVAASICRWPDPVHFNRKTLAALWELMMGYEAPASEFKAWADHFLKDPQRYSKPAGKLKAMLTALFMNPYFLLEH